MASVNYYIQVIWKWTSEKENKGSVNHYLIKLTVADWYNVLKKEVEKRHGTLNKEILHWDGHEIKDVELFYYQTFCEQI